jgi:arsenate reductase-like glutaredoxin family protein
MKKIFYLSTCSTCKRILDQIQTTDFEIQDVKEKNIEPEVLDFIAEKMGGYESIFSKRAMKFRAMGLNELELTESDYRKFMLKEYTFLKRPFIIDGEDVFVGNSKTTVEKIIDRLG